MPIRTGAHGYLLPLFSKTIKFIFHNIYKLIKSTHFFAHLLKLNGPCYGNSGSHPPYISVSFKKKKIYKRQEPMVGAIIQYG